MLVDSVMACDPCWHMHTLLGMGQSWETKNSFKYQTEEIESRPNKDEHQMHSVRLHTDQTQIHQRETNFHNLLLKKDEMYEAAHEIIRASRLYEVDLNSRRHLLMCDTHVAVTCWKTAEHEGGRRGAKIQPWRRSPLPN